MDFRGSDDGTRITRISADLRGYETVLVVGCADGFLVWGMWGGVRRERSGGLSRCSRGAWGGGGGWLRCEASKAGFSSDDRGGGGEIPGNAQSKNRIDAPQRGSGQGSGLRPPNASMAEMMESWEIASSIPLFSLL